MKKIKNTLYQLKLSTSAGTSSIELLIYALLLTTVLTAVYQFFTQVNYQRISEVVEEEIYANGRRVIYDFEQTIKQALVVDEPVQGGSSQTLSLDNGMVIYSLDEQGGLIRTEDGVAEKLTNSQVFFENLTFTNLGPSSEKPTVKVIFTLKGRHLIEGRERSESFQTAVTLR